MTGGGMMPWFPWASVPERKPGIMVTMHDIAQRFIGTTETPGTASNPHVLAMLQLDAEWPKGDDVPWCSAFVNYVAWLLRLPRSKSLRARSWLNVGRAVQLADAVVGFDVVVLKRGTGDQPGPDVIDAPGHVGVYNGRTDTHVSLVGGNQSDAVNVREYPIERVLGVRRLA